MFATLDAVGSWGEDRSVSLDVDFRSATVTITHLGGGSVDLDDLVLDLRGSGGSSTYALGDPGDRYSADLDSDGNFEGGESITVSHSQSGLVRILVIEQGPESRVLLDEQLTPSTATPQVTQAPPPTPTPTPPGTATATPTPAPTATPTPAPTATPTPTPTPTPIANNVEIQQTQINNGDIVIQFRNNNPSSITFQRARLDSYTEANPPSQGSQDPIDRVIYRPSQDGVELVSGDPLESVGGPTISNGGNQDVTVSPQRFTQSGGGTYTDANAEAGDSMTITIEFGDGSTRQYVVNL
jgi:outer membrane biosynthesis protein TonB